MIYLDHAATSWPKPPEVLKAMGDYLQNAGGNPGRSGHRLSIAAGRVVYAAREAVAELFRAPDAMRVIFTPNVTYALNLAIRGLLKPGDRAVTTSMEHNSVMRPLRALEKEGLQLAVVACREDGSIDLEAFRAAMQPGTRLAVINHASNVVGTLMPLKEIAAITHQAGALLLVDAAQTAGVVPIDQPGMGIDLLAFTGHKGLLGPTGTGGLVLGERVDCGELLPLVRGGTGSRSEFEEQPDMLPDKYESGTPNGVGIAGLGAGVRWVLERGVHTIHEYETSLTRLFLERVGGIRGVQLFGSCVAERMTAVISCRLAGKYVSEVGLRLDEEFGVLCRVGLHCAPAAHKTIGSFPEGTIRLAPGIFTTADDINRAAEALEKIARNHE